MHNKSSAITHLSLVLMMRVFIMLIPFTSLNFPNVKAQEYGSYNDDDTYSKYPTEVNNYECRTGLFEGFFVSSVEFCKHIKFDKDRENITGTQRPPGPTCAIGATGPVQQEQQVYLVHKVQQEVGPDHKVLQDLQAYQVLKVKEDYWFDRSNRSSKYCTRSTRSNGINGTQGPPGITYHNDTNTYVVTGHAFNNGPSNNNNIGQAKCEPRDFVITGGFNPTRVIGDPSDVWEEFDKAIFTPLPSGWEVKLGISWTVTIVEWDVYAICCDNPPLRP